MRVLVLAGLIGVAACCQAAQVDRFGQSPATGSPPPTVAPSTVAPMPEPPAATPRHTSRIGEPVVFDDGWRLSVLKVWDDPDCCVTPKPGMHFVSLFVEHRNASTKPVPFGPSFFKMQDSTGTRHDSGALRRTDTLTSSELAEGEHVIGSVTFEVPIGDTKLRLVYEQPGYPQTTIELF